MFRATECDIADHVNNAAYWQPWRRSCCGAGAPIRSGSTWRSSTGRRPSRGARRRAQRRVPLDRGRRRRAARLDPPGDGRWRLTPRRSCGRRAVRWSSGWGAAATSSERWPPPRRCASTTTPSAWSAGSPGSAGRSIPCPGQDASTRSPPAGRSPPGSCSPGREPGSPDRDVRTSPSRAWPPSSAVRPCWSMSTAEPRAVAAGLAAAAASLRRDLIVFVDVGGDVLAQGDEPGLRSPLCDALMLAAAGPAGRRRPPGAARRVRHRLRLGADHRRGARPAGRRGGGARAGRHARPDRAGRRSAWRSRWSSCPPRPAPRRSARSAESAGRSTSAAARAASSSRRPAGADLVPGCPGDDRRGRPARPRRRPGRRAWSSPTTRSTRSASAPSSTWSATRPPPARAIRSRPVQTGSARFRA